MPWDIKWGFLEAEKSREKIVNSIIEFLAMGVNSMKCCREALKKVRATEMLISNVNHWHVLGVWFHWTGCESKEDWITIGWEHWGADWTVCVLDVA